MIRDNQPVFIAGTNGSGTRIYAKILEEAGVFQGLSKNMQHEPNRIITYTRPLVPELIKKTGSITYDIHNNRDIDFDKMLKWINSVALETRSEMPLNYLRWGWKHPRNLFLFPLLLHAFPNSFYLHVIRDGRDMALAPNKGDVNAMYRYLIDASVTNPSSVQCAEFWSLINVELSEFASQKIQERYITTRHEDLCGKPEMEITRILESLEIKKSTDEIKRLAKLVSTPKTKGRWSKAAEDEQGKICDAAYPGLSKFGYI